jgi:gamma-glutamyltranspeptidase/glutathione hydrolase
MKTIAVALAATLFCTQTATAMDLSPGHWTPGAREAAEALEAKTPWPLAARTISGRQGVISATVSPIAVQAGIETLDRGGNAADAAAAVALTQVTTQLGSVVSYAGIMTMLYYDAKTGHITSLDAGYNSYRGETDPGSIPKSDLSALTGGSPPPPSNELGRQTLVPGFMAGVEAMQRRFGRASFADLMAPAIWYADKGVTISPILAGFFAYRQPVLARTEEGRRFLHQAGDDLPKSGDVFRQPQLAETLRGVARDGAAYMYTGPWAKAFVAAVTRDKGKAALDDLAGYHPTWSTPEHTRVFDHDVYVAGAPNLSAYQLLTALNVAAELKLDARAPYWQDAESFRTFARIADAVVGAPLLHPAIVERLKGVDVSPSAQRGEAFARALAKLIQEPLPASTSGESHHSNAIVVVDRDGNIAVMTHTINAAIWGDTGIVVGGIPIPDSAGFQQFRLAQIKPGDRVPNEIADTIVLDKRARPVLATASIGSALLPETMKEILGTIAWHRTPADLAAAPPFLTNFEAGVFTQSPLARAVKIPEGAYDAEFLKKLAALGVETSEVPQPMVASVRGTLAVVAIDPSTGARTTPEQPDVLVFGGVQ